MSVIEELFFHDEEREAEQLERVIEGDEYEDRRRDDSDDNSEKDDEAEEDKRKVDPNTVKIKRITKNPRFILNPARLTGPRGIQVIPEHFKDFKFKGKGYEKNDLDMVLKKLEHWAYRLYPKFDFEDCLKKIETLGKKRPVMTHLTKIRSDQLLPDDTIVQKDSSDDETPTPEVKEDEFDKLLQQQIELARATPARGPLNTMLKTPGIMQDDRSPLSLPKVTSSPSISDEQKARMLRNRQLAEERRLAKLQLRTETQNENPVITDNDINVEEANMGVKSKKQKSNVIDSEDSNDGSIGIVRESIAVDVHAIRNKEDLVNIQEMTNENIDDQNINRNSSIENVISENDKDSSNNLAKEHDEVVDSSTTRNVENNVSTNDFNDRSIETTESSLNKEESKEKDMEIISNIHDIQDNINKNETEISNNEIDTTSKLDKSEIMEENFDSDQNKTNKEIILDNYKCEGVDFNNKENLSTNIITETNESEFMDVDFSDEF